MGLNVLNYALTGSAIEETSNSLGSLKGASCTIKSIVENDDNSVITFEWVGNSGATESSTLTVKNGKDGQDGTDGVAGKDGTDGADGISPTITLNRNAADDGVIITVTDADGITSTVEVKDGIDGAGESVDFTNYYTKDEVDKLVEDISTGNIDLTEYATKEYVNETVFNIAVDTSNLVTDAELANSLSDYTKTADLPQPYDDTTLANKVTDLETAMADKADTSAIPDVSNYVEKEDGKGLFGGSYNDLTDKPTIPSTDGLATETFVTEKIAEAQMEGSDVDLSAYATTEYVDNAVANVTVDTTNLVTAEELTTTLADYAKGTDIPDTSGFLTEIPTEYVTDEELTTTLDGYIKEENVIEMTKEELEALLDVSESDIEGLIDDSQILTTKAYSSSKVNSLITDLGDKYLPVDGSKAMHRVLTLGSTSSEISPTLELKNSLKTVKLQLVNDGRIVLHDETNNARVFTISADMADNTFNGTASGNLPLSGGTMDADANISIDKTKLDKNGLTIDDVENDLYTEVAAEGIETPSLIVDGEDIKELLAETDAKHITFYKTIEATGVTTPTTFYSLQSGMGKNGLLICDTTTSVITNLPTDGILMTSTDSYGNQNKAYVIAPTCYYVGEYVGGGQHEWTKSTDEALSLSGGTMNENAEIVIPSSNTSAYIGIQDETLATSITADSVFVSDSTTQTGSTITASGIDTPSLTVGGVGFGDTDISVFGGTITSAISTIGNCTITNIDISDKITNAAYTGTGTPYANLSVSTFGSFATVQFKMYNITISNSSNIIFTFDGTEEYYDLLSSMKVLNPVLTPITNVSGPEVGYAYVPGNVVCSFGMSVGKFNNITLKFPELTEDKTLTGYPHGTTCMVKITR